jgi:hypothetical protein
VLKLAERQKLAGAVLKAKRAAPPAPAPAAPPPPPPPPPVHNLDGLPALLGCVDSAGHQLAVYHVSDMHVEHKPNLAWLDRLPDGLEPTGAVPVYTRGQPAQPNPPGSSRAVPGSVVLCCGDVATEHNLLRHALRALVRAYSYGPRPAIELTSFVCANGLAPCMH